MQQQAHAQVQPPTGSGGVGRVIELARLHRQVRRAGGEFMRRWDDERRDRVARGLGRLARAIEAVDASLADEDDGFDPRDGLLARDR